MSSKATFSPSVSRPRLVGRFVASQALIWWLAAPILGAAAARLAVWTQNFRAPLLIFPLLVGAGLGLMLMGLMRLAQVGHRATLWSGAILAVAVAVTGQHYFSFLDFKAALAAQRPKDLSAEMFQEMMPEESLDFARFMRRQAALGRPITTEFRLGGTAAWASWALDGLLVLLATLAIICLACRAPYCSVCRSWYRTTRAGPLNAEMARRMAAAASLPGVDPPGEAQYRFSHCVGGCGPGRLELAWSGPRQSKVAEAWLSAVQREQVVRVLDRDGTT